MCSINFLLCVATNFVTTSFVSPADEGWITAGLTQYTLRDYDGCALSFQMALVLDPLGTFLDGM